MTCVSCHNADDIHGGSFGKGCERCHVTKDWKTIKQGASARDFTPLARAVPWVWIGGIGQSGEANFQAVQQRE